ncbi:MAG TPA: rhodanese-like domain-containing protein [Mycobacteriales bacterium]|nr:rhodanese-like domain-containing protein [Mycobacteriales bacterium]
MVKEVDIAALVRAQVEGLHLVDVREPDEYAAGHVPGARNLPLSTLPLSHHELPRGECVFVICASGARSQQAARTLELAGFDAVSVTGGTAAWVRDGHPVLTGTQPSQPGGTSP